MTDKQRYYSLLALVCEDLPAYAVEMAIRAGYVAHSKEAHRRLSNIKQGKIASLPDLVALVRYAMPDYPIPAHLLPAPAPVAA